MGFRLQMPLLSNLVGCLVSNGIKVIIHSGSVSHAGINQLIELVLAPRRDLWSILIKWGDPKHLLASQCNWQLVSGWTSIYLVNTSVDFLISWHKRLVFGYLLSTRLVDAILKAVCRAMLINWLVGWQTIVDCIHFWFDFGVLARANEVFLRGILGCLAVWVYLLLLFVGKSSRNSFVLSWICWAHWNSLVDHTMLWVFHLLLGVGTVWRLLVMQLVYGFVLVFYLVWHYLLALGFWECQLIWLDYLINFIYL